MHNIFTAHFCDWYRANKLRVHSCKIKLVKHKADPQKKINRKREKKDRDIKIEKKKEREREREKKREKKRDVERGGIPPASAQTKNALLRFRCSNIV